MSDLFPNCHRQYIQILKWFHGELIATDYHEKNEVKDFLARNFRLGYLSNFKKLPRIWVASSKTPVEEFIFKKNWVPLCKFSRVFLELSEDLKAVEQKT